MRKPIFAFLAFGIMLTANCQMPKTIDALSSFSTPINIISSYDSGFLISSWDLRNTILPEIYKIDLNGNTLWRRVINGESAGISKITELDNGHIAIGGTVVIDGAFNPYFCTLDACGNITYSVVFKGFENGNLFDFQVLNATEYLMMFSSSNFELDPITVNTKYSLFCVYNTATKKIRSEKLVPLEYSNINSIKLNNKIYGSGTWWQGPDYFLGCTAFVMDENLNFETVKFFDNYIKENRNVVLQSNFSLVPINSYLYTAFSYRFYTKNFRSATLVGKIDFSFNIIDSTDISINWSQAPYSDTENFRKITKYEDNTLHVPISIEKEDFKGIYYSYLTTLDTNLKIMNRILYGDSSKYYYNVIDATPSINNTMVNVFSRYGATENFKIELVRTKSDLSIDSTLYLPNKLYDYKCPNLSTFEVFDFSMFDTLIVETKAYPLVHFSGLEHIEKQQSIIVYPNPTKDFLNIRETTNFEFKVFDVQSREVLNGRNTSGQIDVSSLKNGLYLLSLKDAKNQLYFSRFEVLN